MPLISPLMPVPHERLISPVVKITYATLSSNNTQNGHILVPPDQGPRGKRLVKRRVRELQLATLVVLESGLGLESRLKSIFAGLGLRLGLEYEGHGHGTAGF